MEKSNRMIQVYGYIICIVAIITFLITVSGSIHAFIDLSDPESSIPGDIRSEKPRLASFEIYQMDVMTEFKSSDGKVDASLIPDEATLRAMYDAAKADRIQYQVHNARQDLIANGIVMLISILLFITHWTWMKRISPG